MRHEFGLKEAWKVEWYDRLSQRLEHIQRQEREFGATIAAVAVTLAGLYKFAIFDNRTYLINSAETQELAFLAVAWFWALGSPLFILGRRVAYRAENPYEPPFAFFLHYSLAWLVQGFLVWAMIAITFESFSPIQIAPLRTIAAAILAYGLDFTWLVVKWRGHEFKRPRTAKSANIVLRLMVIALLGIEVVVTPDWHTAPLDYGLVWIPAWATIILLAYAVSRIPSWQARCSKIALRDIRRELLANRLSEDQVKEEYLLAMQQSEEVNDGQEIR